LSISMSNVMISLFVGSLQKLLILPSDLFRNKLSSLAAEAYSGSSLYAAN